MKINQNNDDTGGDEGGGGSGKRFTAFSQKEFSKIVDRGGFHHSPDFVADNLGDDALKNPVGDDPAEATQQAQEEHAASAKSYTDYGNQDAASKISSAVSKSFSALSNAPLAQKHNPAANPRGDRNSAFLAARAAAGESRNGMQHGNSLGFNVKGTNNASSSGPSFGAKK